MAFFNSWKPCWAINQPSYGTSDKTSTQILLTHLLIRNRTLNKNYTHSTLDMYAICIQTDISICVFVVEFNRREVDDDNEEIDQCYKEHSDRDTQSS